MNTLDLTTILERNIFYNKVNHYESVLKLYQKIKNYEKSILIERGLYNYSVDYVLNKHIDNLFVNIYNYKLNTILNIKEDILSLEIDCELLSRLELYELLPDYYIDIINKINKMNEKYNHIEYSDVYICKRCHQKKCISKVVSTRSLDENLTTIISCCNCGYTFTP